MSKGEATFPTDTPLQSGLCEHCFALAAGYIHLRCWDRCRSRVAIYLSSRNLWVCCSCPCCFPISTALLPCKCQKSCISVRRKLHALPDALLQQQCQSTYAVVLNVVLCTCRTCVGRVVEGEVDMSDVSALQTQVTSIRPQSLTFCMK